MTQPREQRPPDPSEAVAARLAQLRAACLMVRNRVAPTVSITSPRIPDAAALAAIATRMAAAEGVSVTVEIGASALTIHLRSAAAED
jgi:hypothetical protein